ncbi:MAG: hypothetical protein U9N87_05135 [Planctomycetota bacterium]|nr:hypothetical protein [Planctomycetota bacterium]
MDQRPREIKEDRRNELQALSKNTSNGSGGWRLSRAKTPDVRHQGTASLCREPPQWQFSDKA